MKNNISLSVVSNGAVYTTDSTQDSLVGIIYNNRIGFGVYNETSCTNDLDPVQDARYSIMNRDIYVSYNELAWSTGGAGFDITYLTSSTYCQELLLQAFTFALFSDATCDFYCKYRYIMEYLQKITLLSDPPLLYSNSWTSKIDFLLNYDPLAISKYAFCR